MPLAPSAAQSATSRANGTLSRGPATPEGKARSAQNATRHGLRGTSRVLSPEDAVALAALREGLSARLAPADAVEEHWVGEMAFALWQQQKLQALTALVLSAAVCGTSEPETTRLPFLATLARYRARIERDLRLAQQELEAAHASRPRLPASANLANPARLRWLADRIEAGLRESPPTDCTNEPGPQAPNEPGPASAACDTREPEAAAAAASGGADRVSSGNGPAQLVPQPAHPDHLEPELLHPPLDHGRAKEGVLLRA